MQTTHEKKIAPFVFMFLAVHSLTALNRKRCVGSVFYVGVPSCDLAVSETFGVLVMGG